MLKKQQKKKAHATVKARLHARNKHRERYDFAKLIASCPDLAKFVKPNKYGDDSVDFFNPAAVKMLNKALLKHHYNIENWGECKVKGRESLVEVYEIL